MNETEALILLNLIEGLGPVRIRSLLSHVGSAEDLFGASAEKLTRFGLSESLVHAVLEAPRGGMLKEELDLIEKEGVILITFQDERYPKALKEIHDFPVVLYLKGGLQSDDRLALAIVGSRRATPYGLEMAERIAREITGYGFLVVSGFARGVDTAAHQGALSAGGRTVAVLGSGLSSIYPPENRSLVKEVSQHGALISEFPMSSPPLSQHFPQRNRLISGLSLGVLVVEADEKSGALITAHCAAEQGREVFAIPGRIDSPLSRGTHRLIREGATLVQDLTDILEELKVPIARETGKETLVKSLPPLSQEEEVVYEVLSELPKSIDAIVEEAQLSAKETLAALLQLEVKHLVRTYPGRHYARK